MEKILLLTDSASDLTPEDEARTGIRVLNLPVSVEGKEYTDRVDLTPDEMYQILNTCKELPTTAHLNMVDFAEAFQKAAEEGYTDIIYMGLNSHGSATYQSALLGKKLFYEHLPQYADVKIHLLDSLSYSYGYGYPLVLAAARLPAPPGALFCHVYPAVCQAVGPDRRGGKLCGGDARAQAGDDL